MKSDTKPLSRRRQGGSDYAWSAGAETYTLKGDIKQIGKYAGHAVRITGDVSGTTVTFNEPVIKSNETLRL